MSISRRTFIGQCTTAAGAAGFASTAISGPCTALLGQAPLKHDAMPMQNPAAAPGSVRLTERLVDHALTQTDSVWRTALWRVDATALRLEPEGVRLETMHGLDRTFVWHELDSMDTQQQIAMACGEDLLQALCTERGIPLRRGLTG